jgi:hypothetical protein
VDYKITVLGDFETVFEDPPDFTLFQDQSENLSLLTFSLQDRSLFHDLVLQPFAFELLDSQHFSFGDYASWSPGTPYQ